MEPPEILPGYGEWVDAFWYLSRDRAQGGHIPAASIDRHVVGWADDEAAFFRRVILALDDVCLEHHNPEGGAQEPEQARDAFRAAMKAHDEGRRK